MPRPVKTVRVKVTLEYDIPAKGYTEFRAHVAEYATRHDGLVFAAIEQPADVVIKAGEA